MLSAAAALTLVLSLALLPIFLAVGMLGRAAHISVLVLVVFSVGKAALVRIPIYLVLTSADAARGGTVVAQAGILAITGLITSPVTSPMASPVAVHVAAVVVHAVVRVVSLALTLALGRVP